MTLDQCVTVWRELVDVVRLMDAVQTVTATEQDQAVWRAGLTALDHRRTVLAAVLSLEDPAQLDAAYARLVSEELTDATDPHNTDPLYYAEAPPADRFH